MTGIMRMPIIFIALPELFITSRVFNRLSSASVSPPFGYYFPTDFPEIKKMTRLLDNGLTPLRYKDKLINENNVYFADENFFDVFSVNVLKGNPKTALS